MAYQQIQIPCPAATWTQILDYRPKRKSLIVQCPQVAMTVQQTLITSSTDPLTFCAANPLRKKLILTCSTVHTTWFGIDPAGGSGPNNQTGIPLATAVYNMAVSHLSQYEVDGPLAQQAWYGMNGANVQDYAVFEEIYQCAGLILATTQYPVAAGTPFGSYPPGYWLSAELDSSNVKLSLTQDADGEQVIQRWYAYPIGSIAVNVTVSEAWDIDQPLPDIKKFRVDLPKLSDAAIAALDELIDRIGQFDDSMAV